MSLTKQVIVMRQDLKMRRGKEIAQGSHASMAFLTRRLEAGRTIHLTDVEKLWLSSSFAKVCVRVKSEAELLEVYEKAKAAGLEAHLVMDSGRTEFGGVPTHTCVAIGPGLTDEIDAVTGRLELY